MESSPGRASFENPTGPSRLPQLPAPLRSRSQFLGVLALSLFVAVTLLVVNRALPLEFPLVMPRYYQNAQEWAASGRITDTFMPIGYEFPIGVAFRLGGDTGIVAFSVAGYLLTLAVFLTMLRASGVSPLLSIGLTAAFALHPYLLVDLKRINDNNVNVLFMLILLSFILFPAALARAKWAAACGACVAAFFLTRGNAVTLIVLPLVMLWKIRASVRIYAAAVVTFFTVWVATSLMATGQPLFFPENGSVTFFHGNNSSAEQSLLLYLNGENLSGTALAAAGLTPAESVSYSPQEYRDLALGFIRANPLEFAKLILVRIVTLFRVDWRQATNLPKKIIQVTLIFPFLGWIALATATISRRGWSETDTWIALLVGLYILPFALTNSDPRYRLPLDAVFVVDGVRRFAEIAAERETGRTPESWRTRRTKVSRGSRSY